MYKQVSIFLFGILLLAAVTQSMESPYNNHAPFKNDQLVDKLDRQVKKYKEKAEAR